MSPDDAEVRALQHNMQTRWDGFVHLLHRPRNGKSAEYAVVFTPVTKEDAAPVQRFATLDDLKEFLSVDLHLPPSSMVGALEGVVRREGVGVIYPVAASLRQLRKLGWFKKPISAPPPSHTPH
jgi:hypothetical protein